MTHDEYLDQAYSFSEGLSDDEIEELKIDSILADRDVAEFLRRADENRN